jgi:hypothetical protein
MATTFPSDLPAAKTAADTVNGNPISASPLRRKGFT